MTPWVGAEGQVLVYYDRLADEYGIRYYAGVTAGASVGIGAPVITGVFTFTGDESDMEGFSAGAQGASGVAVGVAVSIPSLEVLSQFGIEVGLAAELTAGWTFDGEGTSLSNNLRVLDGYQFEKALENGDYITYSTALIGGSWFWQTSYYTIADDGTAVPPRTTLIEMTIESQQYLASGGLLDEPSPNLFLPHNECFPAGTPILLTDGSEVTIEEIDLSTIIMAYDTAGNLVPGRVTQILTNITTEWIELSNGTTVTPGHRYLKPEGGFEEIGKMLEAGGGECEVVLADGSLQKVTGERIVYSAETAHLYEESEKVVYEKFGDHVLRSDACGLYSPTPCRQADDLGICATVH